MSASQLTLSLRMALRELRGGLRGFHVFVACIALGVAAIAGVNSLARALTEGIAAEGRVILGGDLAFSLVQREATEAELAFLRRSGDVAQVATLRSVAQGSRGDAQVLVELKAVDGKYPQGGVLRLESGEGEIQDFLQKQQGRFGALVAPELLDRLDIGMGDEIRLGGLMLQVRGIIRAEPDRLSSGIGFGPRMIVSIAALRETGLVRPGSLVTWIYRVTLPDEESERRDFRRIQRQAARDLPEAGWNIRNRLNASPGLRRNIERFSQFLTLVGLTALVVGGVGVANAVRSFVDLRRPAIATFKCLGAASGLVFRIYLIQMLLVAAIGVAIGLAIGALLPFAARAALADLVPVSAIGVYPRELGLAALYGFLVTLCFSLGPLGRVRQMSATSLFADRAIMGAARSPLPYRLAQALAVVALAGLAVMLAGDGRLAMTYIISVAIAFVVLWLISRLIMAAAARVGMIRGTPLRLAVRNMHRPGTLTPSVVLSLGLGLTLLVSLAMIDANLRSQLSGSVAQRAPDFFFLDVQDAELEAFNQLLGKLEPGGVLQTVPMLRGRFVAVQDVPAEQVRPGEGSSWALRGDRGITYADIIPENSRLVEGDWWPQGYDGKPLVSLEREIAEGLGVGIGETITVNVLGRDVTARVANLREVEWESLAINFVMVFSPNTFRGAPHTNLATLKLPPSPGGLAAGQLLSSVLRAFPGVTAISVRDAIASVNETLGQLNSAVRLAASLALLISMLVLGGALAAGHRQRRQDTVILKSLGATRRTLLSAFSLEYGLLGLATAIFAVAAGSLAAWYVVTRIMELEFTPDGWIPFGAVTLALATTLGLGLAGTWRILSVKPAAYLKNL